MVKATVRITQNIKPPNKIYRIAAIAVVLLIQSCDPAMILVVKTSGKQNTSVTIYANTNFLPQANRDSPQKIIISVPIKGTIIKNDTTFYYGLGGWGDKELMMEYSKNIDSIIIINSDNQLSLTNQADITNYLLKHRHGFAKSILTIEAK